MNKKKEEEDDDEDFLFLFFNEQKKAHTVRYHSLGSLKPEFYSMRLLKLLEAIHVSTHLKLKCHDSNYNSQTHKGNSSRDSYHQATTLW